MKKALVVTFVFAALFCLSSCASAPVPIWKADDTQGIIGKTEAQIIEKFGQPDSIQRGSEKKIFEYRKAAEKESISNKLVAFGTWGVFKGSKSMFVDILTIVFKDNVVADFSYKENVQSLSLPGF